MINFKKYTYGVTVALALSACSNDNMDLPGSRPDAVGDTFTISGCVTVPAMPVAGTRGNAAETPGADLKLTLFEFSKGADGSSSFLTNIYQAETTSATAVANGQTVRFNVTLNSTSDPRRLHLFVADEFLSSGFGSEADILPALSTSLSNGLPQEAYWGIEEFDNGYVDIDNTTDEMTLLPEVKTKLTDVPVIRNFCKISVSSDAANFTLEGFRIVNEPTSGTIAPWNPSKMNVPSLLNGNGTMKGYADVKADGYQGILPSGVSFANQEEEVKTQNGSDWTAEDRFVYEHPFESSRRTYLIIKGKYGANAESSFYKIDLGAIDKDNNNIFTHYNLIRNIHYKVTIKGVTSAGASSPSGAVDGVVYNNLSASVETLPMLNISDGTNMLFVSHTTIVFVDTNPIKFRYRYVENFGKTGENENNGAVKEVDLKQGDVISSISYGTDNDGGETWKTVTITPATPDNMTKTQEFYIVDPNGLSRTIQLILRKPWEITALPYTDNAELNYGEISGTTVISKEAKKAMSLYIDLPDGLNQSIFPLEFTIEDKKQWLENNPVGNMAVKSGKSLHDSSKTAIQYVKTVTYDEYLYMLGEDNKVSDKSDSNKNTRHRIPCRMLTISAASGTSSIAVSNPYFEIKTVEYSRN